MLGVDGRLAAAAARAGGEADGEDDDEEPHVPVAPHTGTLTQAAPPCQALVYLSTSTSPQTPFCPQAR